MARFSTAMILAKQQLFSFHCLTLIKNKEQSDTYSLSCQTGSKPPWTTGRQTNGSHTTDDVDLCWLQSTKTLASVSLG